MKSLLLGDISPTNITSLLFEQKDIGYAEHNGS